MITRPDMADGLRDIRNVFQGLQTLYETYLPKVDPVLIHDLLVREKEKFEKSPFYMVEIFTKPGTNSEEMKNKIYEKTGWLPAIYDHGTHYVTNQRLTLEVKEISTPLFVIIQEVLEVGERHMRRKPILIDCIFLFCVIL